MKEKTVDNNNQNPNPLMPETNGTQNEITNSTAGIENDTDRMDTMADQTMTENSTAPAAPNLNDYRMESNTNAMPNPPMAQVMEPKKRGAGTVIALVTAVAVALAGAGFGVYESLETKKAQDKLAKAEKLVKQKEDAIKALEKSGTQRTENPTQQSDPKPGDKPKPNEGPENGQNQSGGGIDIKNANGAYIQNQTLFVPGWGLKFKLPNDLTNYGIAVDYTDNDKNETNSLGVNAILKSDYQKNPQALYYDDIYSCAMTRVEKIPGTAPSAKVGNTTYKQFNGYFIGVSDFSTPKCEVRLNIDKVIKKLETAFFNPEKM